MLKRDSPFVLETPRSWTLIVASGEVLVVSVAQSCCYLKKQRLLKAVLYPTSEVLAAELDDVRAGLR